MTETANVMRHSGISPIALVDFPVPLLVAAIRTLSASLLRAVLARRVATARGDKLPSLLLDLRAGKRETEIEFLNGAVAAHAAQIGISAPANAIVARIVSGIAAGTVDWTLFRNKPQALAAALCSPLSPP